MKYRILTRVADVPNYNSIYKYHRKIDGDTVTIWETENIEELDSEVEKLLDNYIKDDIEIIIHGNYEIDADITEHSFD